MTISSSGPNNYTTAQLQAILAAWQDNAYGIPFDYPTQQNINTLAALTNWVRDGVNPDASGYIGPSGTITGATNATPIVVTTSAPHGLSSGDAVQISGVGGNTNVNGLTYIQGTETYIIPSFVQVLSSTTFALYSNPALTNAVAGNAAYTSGGTWQWCIQSLANNTELYNLNVNINDIRSNIAIGDCSAATALQGTQSVAMPLFLQPGGQLQLSNSSGVETNAGSWIDALTAAGTTSRKSIKNGLFLRNGSFGERLLNVANQSNYGFVLSPVDAAAVLVGHY